MVKRLVLAITLVILKNLRLDILFNLGDPKLHRATTWSILRREVIATIRCLLSLVILCFGLGLGEGISSVHPTMLIFFFVSLLSYYFEGLFVWTHQFSVTWLPDPLVDEFHALMYLFVISIWPLNNAINIFLNLLARFQNYLLIIDDRTSLTSLILRSWHLFLYIELVLQIELYDFLFILVNNTCLVLHNLILFLNEFAHRVDLLHFLICVDLPQLLSLLDIIEQFFSEILPLLVFSLEFTDLLGVPLIELFEIIYMTIHRFYLLIKRPNFLLICVVLLILGHVITLSVLLNLICQILILTLQLFDLVVEAFNFILMIKHCRVHFFVHLFHFSNFICVVSHFLFELNKLDILLYDLLLLVLNKVWASLGLLIGHVTILDEELCIAELKID